MNKLEFGIQMQRRTKQFAISIVKFFSTLRRTDEGRVLGRQLLRSGTSVAANYRAACRAKSSADFISKLGTAVEEADESLFWIELLEEAGVCTPANIISAKNEADELLRILATSLATAKQNRREDIR